MFWFARMNPSHHGTGEQMFGAKQQSCTGGRATKNVDLPMNGGQPSCSDLPISGGPGMNSTHHGSDEQVFGAKQQVLRTGPSD
jgi:hypothetical protein